jgi:Polyphosphate kinase 2 (PPK2)
MVNLVPEYGLRGHRQRPPQHVAEDEVKSAAGQDRLTPIGFDPGFARWICVTQHRSCRFVHRAAHVNDDRLCARDGGEVTQLGCHPEDQDSAAELRAGQPAVHGDVSHRGATGDTGPATSGGFPDRERLLPRATDP